MTDSTPGSPDSEFEELQFPEQDHEVDCVTDGKLSPGCHHVPFKEIHETQKRFASIERKVFIPGIPVKVSIVDAFKSGSNILSPYLYVIQVEHGDYQWIINRRYRHFQHLHRSLQMFHAANLLPIPTKKHKERRRTLKRTTSVENRKLPRFPKRPEALISAEFLPKRAQQLEEYLESLLLSPLYRNHEETLAFLEVSNFSFIYELGNKHKEGMVKKRAGGHHIVTGCRFFMYMCKSWVARYSPRWLLLKDTFIAYVHPDTGKVNFVILMDQGFDVQTGIYQTGIHNGILITNLTRRLLVNCPSNRTTKEWHDEIIAASKDTGKDFTQPNRFGSFAPVRTDTLGKFYIHGSSYFSAVADAMEAAKEEIFIADWMLSPELVLKRPNMEGTYWRLDKLLQRKAQQGVKIFVLLYKEIEYALGINSLHGKQTLVEQHPENIKVLRHPDMAQGTLLWAHHEKIVVVDQKYAFLGGIDLCYGRWDTPEHRLTDLGGVAVQKNLDTDGPKSAATTNITGFGAYNIFQLAHATHAITMTPFNIAANKEEKHLSKQLHAHHNGSRFALLPPSSKPNPNSESDSDESSGSDADGLDTVELHKPQEQQTARRRLGKRRRKRRQRKRSLDNEFLVVAKTRAELTESLPPLKHASSDTELNKDDKVEQTGTKLWVGKDYTNFIVRDFVDLHLPFQDLVDRTTTPRMPWHDVGMTLQGKAAQDVARHFIQRWNFTKADKAKEHPSYPWLLPKAYNQLEEVVPIGENLGPINAQIIRSVSTWSAGINITEHSIETACIYAIENAQHFVYMENQFFITQTSGSKDVTNGIGDALYRRIIRAHNSKTPFRVYVVIPLLPAFEGKFGTSQGIALQAVTHWNYASICRGPDSLMGRLSSKVGDPAAYVSFYGLRNHDILSGNLVSELVYVHSKVLIADDRIAITGSANINDRSLTGKRDSEIGVFLEDTDLVPGRLGGNDVMVGRVVSKLRRQLFKEFLGCLTSNPHAIDVTDPVVDDFYKDMWLKTAALNTSIYEKVFRCLPTDDVHNFEQLRDYQTKIPLAVSDAFNAQKMLAEVRGYLVLFPLYFLCDEDLTPPAGTKEALMPTALWV